MRLRCTTTILALLSALALIAAPSVQAQEPVPLLTQKPVSGGLSSASRKLSMRDRIFGSSLYLTGRRSGFAVYDLGRKYRRLEAHVGVADDSSVSSTRSYAYRFAVDGRTVASGEVSKNDPPARISLDLHGAESLRVQIDAPLRVADPTLFPERSADSYETGDHEQRGPTSSPSGGLRGRLGAILGKMPGTLNKIPGSAGHPQSGNGTEPAIGAGNRETGAHRTASTRGSLERAQQRAATSRSVLVRLSAPHGTYRAELFKVGDARPTKVLSGIQPAGGKMLLFGMVPASSQYFFRVTNLESGETRQPPAFYLPDKPRGTQRQKDIVW